MAKTFIRMVALGLLFSAHASAVIVDAATFRKHGGHPSNAHQDIKDRHVLNQLRMFGYSRPWLGTGHLGYTAEDGVWHDECSATWIGEDHLWSYILTAAHCIPYADDGERQSVTYKAWDETVIAEGIGEAHTPPVLEVDEDGNDWGADLAILKLPRRKTPTDDTGAPLQEPVFNDSPLEIGKTAIFVGYGSWGVGDTEEESYLPSYGMRRLYGRSVIDAFRDLRRTVVAGYDSMGPSANWSRTSLLDSGSAIWQFQGDQPVIAAVASTGDDYSSDGVRIWAHLAWIKRIYPAARLLSERKPVGCIVRAGPLNVNSRRKYCLHAGSADQLPDWAYEKAVDVQADSGVTVTLSDSDQLAQERTATFIGTVENPSLRHVKATNGQYLDLSRPRTMRVDRISGHPLGCVVSLISAEKYCLAADSHAAQQVPAWIAGHDIFVQADPGVTVILWNPQRSQGAGFHGTMQHHELKRVALGDGTYLDLSQAAAMSVLSD